MLILSLMGPSSGGRGLAKNRPIWTRGGRKRGRGRVRQGEAKADVLSAFFLAGVVL